MSDLQTQLADPAINPVNKYVTVRRSDVAGVLPRGESRQDAGALAVVFGIINLLLATIFLCALYFVSNNVPGAAVAIGMLGVVAVFVAPAILFIVIHKKIVAGKKWALVSGLVVAATYAGWIGFNLIVSMAFGHVNAMSVIVGVILSIKATVLAVRCALILVAVNKIGRQPRGFEPILNKQNSVIDDTREFKPVLGSHLPDARSALIASPQRVGLDAYLRLLTGDAAATILLMLLGLIAVLLIAAIPSIREFGWSFLTGTEWRANSLETPKKGPDGKIIIEDGETVMEVKPPVFGALPVIFGTIVSSALALLFAVPLSFGASLFLVRIANRTFAQPISFLIEFLAAIPSIAYGIWGLFVVAPFLQDHLEPFLRDTLGGVPGFKWLFFETITVAGKTITRQIPLVGRDMFSGGIILAIMIVPIITAISRDVLRSVPRIQIEGTMALGATWWQTSWGMLRYSRSALFGAVMLGLARAAGETMAITMVIGNNNQIRASIFAPAQTMSSLLANEFSEATGPSHVAALSEVALVLLVMSLIFNIIARWLVVGKGARGAAGH